ncbi:MAG: hypothetical protein HQM08_00380 [Candidatus Riflebacteria bacterium]|nr:hypothetical protein [Candidatus Riflebacteria bacterium]
MLIHVGNGNYIKSDDCVMIINYHTIDQNTKNAILKNCSNLNSNEVNSGILTKKQKFIPSTFSSFALAGRESFDYIAQALYKKPGY